MCDCGCNTCETKSTALVLNESKAPATILSEGLKHHIDNNKPLTEHLYRAGSRAYFDLFAEARSLYSRGILEFTHEDDISLLTETHLGHFGMFEDKKVPLDFPIELTEKEINEIYDLYEAKKKKKKGPKLNKPMRSTSGGKAYKVYVKDPKTGNVKTVRFGSGGLRAKINDRKARQAFAKRHKCSTRNDKTKASYWSCRLPRYAKLLGLKSSFSGFW
tara:strand:+ start:109 stop:759 length:651 start_codon:yes stop_codon:yes gene_type:complete